MEADKLFDNIPIVMTECYLSSSKYIFKFNKNKVRQKRKTR